MERYIKDDVVRYGARLVDLEKKLVGAYRDSVIIPYSPFYAYLTNVHLHRRLLKLWMTMLSLATKEMTRKTGLS